MNKQEIPYAPSELASLLFAACSSGNCIFGSTFIRIDHFKNMLFIDFRFWSITWRVTKIPTKKT